MACSHNVNRRTKRKATPVIALRQLCFVLACVRLSVCSCVAAASIRGEFRLQQIASPALAPGQRATLIADVVNVLLILAIGGCVLYSPADPVWRPAVAPDATEIYYAALNRQNGLGYTISLNGKQYLPRYSFGLETLFVRPLLVLGWGPHHALNVATYCGILNLALMYLLVRSMGTAWAAALAAVLLLLAPDYGLAARDLLSHTPCLTLLLLVALCLPTCRSHPWAWVVVGLLTGISVCTRPLNVVLVPALLLAGIGMYRNNFRTLLGGIVAFLLGFLPFLIPLLISNSVEFGSITRNGYAYWCSVPYDFTDLTFPLNRASLSSGLSVFLFPFRQFLSRTAEVTPGSTLLIVLVVVTFASAWIRMFRSGGNGRTIAIFSMAVIAGVGALHVAYAFKMAWLFLPCYALIIPFMAIALTRSQETDSGRSLFGPAWCLALCLVALGSRRMICGMDADSRRETGLVVQSLSTRLPEDCVFVTSLDPLTMQMELATNYDRVIIPLSPFSEYASKVVVRRPPGPEARAIVKRELQGRERRFFTWGLASPHLMAIRWGGEDVLPETFATHVEAILNRYKGRRTIVMVDDGKELAAALPPGFEVEPFGEEKPRLFEIVRPQ